ncbi:unnamed protein product, partial [Diabrotica balteata]
ERGCFPVNAETVSHLTAQRERADVG